MNYKFVNSDKEKRKDFLEDFKQFHDDISQTTLIFQDEMASKLNPNKGYIWTREEKPFIERFRLNFFNFRQSLSHPNTTKKEVILKHQKLRPKQFLGCSRTECS